MKSFSRHSTHYSVSTEWSLYLVRDEQSCIQLAITYEIIKEEPSGSFKQFREEILVRLDQRVKDERVSFLKYTLTEERPPAISVIPFVREKIAVVQTRWESVPSITDLLAHPGLVGGYTVEEAFPVKYERAWPLRTRTPGVCLLTLFNKRHDISEEEFLDRWHNGHTPLSLEIHPLWHYSRNRVISLIKPDSIHIDGIVEEHTRTRADLLNPTRFFGGPLRMLPNMIRTYFDVRAFLDYHSIKPFLTAEYYLKDLNTANLKHPKNEDSKTHRSPDLRIPNS